MFSRTPFNGDISRWNVSSVTNMYAMFEESSFNGDISGWNVSSVTNMYAMFSSTPFNGDISKWKIKFKTQKIKRNMFNDCPIPEDNNPR